VTKIAHFRNSFETRSSTFRTGHSKH